MLALNLRIKLKKKDFYKLIQLASKCLSCEHEDPRADYRHACLWLSVVMCTRSPSAQEVETGRSLGFTDQTIQPNGLLRVQ